MPAARNADATQTARLIAFAELAAAALATDERVRVIWLTGSLAAGTADAQSDVDLRAAIRVEDFDAAAEHWPHLIQRIAPSVWQRRWPGPPDEAILSAITPDYVRFDLVLQSTADMRPRALSAARVLWDPDDLAHTFPLATDINRRHDPLAHLSETVTEFIRLLGMLPLVVARDDIAIGMEGQMAAHSLLLSLLLMEQGIDRAASGKRRVMALLNDEQRAVLASVPALAPTMESVIAGRVTYARLFLPRARRLMTAHGFAYPAVFEAATWRHLHATLGLRRDA